SSVWRTILKRVAAGILFVSAIGVNSIGIDYLEDDSVDQAITAQGLKSQDEITLTSTDMQDGNAFFVHTADERSELSG
ncbi:RDD family protein, partial [Pseudoalteromonas sp. S409]